jgi:hypothetical protein
MTASKLAPLGLAAGERLKEMVAAYRAARGADGPPVTERPDVRTECNNVATTPTKRKAYPLPPAEFPTPIDGFPLNPPGQDIPTYSSRETAIGAWRRMRRRLDGSAILEPNGPPELRKRSQ